MMTRAVNKSVILQNNYFLIMRALCHEDRHIRFNDLATVMLTILCLFSLHDAGKKDEKLKPSRQITNITFLPLLECWQSLLSTICCCSFCPHNDWPAVMSRQTQIPQ